MKNKKNMGLWLSLLIVMGIVVLPTTPMVKVGIALILMGGFVFWKRSIFFYIQGNRHLIKKDQQEWHKAWPLYQKALRSGLIPAYRITVASMYIQRDDANEGKAIIEDYLADDKKKEDKALTNIAKTMLSMVYWMENDMEKAIGMSKRYMTAATVTRTYSSTMAPMPWNRAIWRLPVCWLRKEASMRKRARASMTTMGGSACLKASGRRRMRSTPP
jgi:hypothetical protein